MWPFSINCHCLCLGMMAAIKMVRTSTCIHTSARSYVQLPCSKAQLEREKAANVHYDELVRRKKALERSSSTNKRKFDETGVEEIDDEDSLGVKLDSQ